MYRSRPKRRSTAWTRRSGVLVVVAVYATLIAGVFPPVEDPRVLRDIRLTLFGCTLACLLLWVVASVRAPRADGVVLDKTERQGRRPSRGLPILIGLAIPLASAAALTQAVGPDGEQGRWLSQVYAAGGGSYEVPIDKVLNSPRTTGVSNGDVDQYAADVTVTLRFHDETRSVTVHGATTFDSPEEGDTVAVVYAPDRPGLGVRPEAGTFLSSDPSHFWLWPFLWIWSLALCLGAFTAVFFALSGETVHLGRRFSADVHGVAALFLIVGVCLLLPGAFFYTSTWAGWLLAVAAASTPWLALTWVLRRMPAPANS